MSEYCENCRSMADERDRYKEALVKIASNGRVPNDSRIFDKAQYRAGYVCGFERQADIARSALSGDAKS